MKKKLIIYFLLLTFLMPSNLVQAKPNANGEVMNLPPFVDFEVTEKQKVDVIVDIGNVSYSEDEINNVINTTLRPQLTAKGLDYNIIVKDTSEGISHFYYHMVGYGERKLYKFDFMDRQLSQIQNLPSTYTSATHTTNIVSYLRDSAFYDPNKNVLFTLKDYQFLDLSTRQHINQLYDYQENGNRVGYGGMVLKDLDKVDYYSDGTLTAILRQNPTDGLPYRTVVYYDRLEQENGLYHAYRRYSESLPRQGTTTPVYYYSDPNKSIWINYSTQSGSGNGAGWSNLHFYNFSQLKNLPVTMPKNEVNAYVKPRNLPQAYSESPVYRINETDGYFYRIGTVSETSTSSRDYPNKYEGNSYTPAPDFPRANNTQYYNDTNGYTRVYKNEYDTDKQVYYRMSTNQINLIRGFGSPITVLNLPHERNTVNRIYPLGEFGSHIVFMVRLNNALDSIMYAYNVETNEFIHITTYMATRETSTQNAYNPESYIVPYKYPVDYDGKKYLVKDVIEEQQHRYDADVYYIRLDNNLSEQFSSADNAVEIANLMQANNMTFIGVGNNVGKPQHDNMLTMLEHNGKTILNQNNLQAAFSEATNFIVNKKVVDLHVLDTQTAFNRANVQSFIDTIKQQLRGSNYIIHTHYITSQEPTLINLLEQVNWNDRRNNYILFLDNSPMTDVDDEDYYTFFASQMNSNYAHFISYGQEQAREKNEQILELMNNRGQFNLNTATLTQLISQIKTYIEQTAETNPKRHIQKLVLQHNPVTDEYSSEIELNAYYYDHEGDRQKAERFKTEHDPTVYENHTGLMAQTGIYLDSAITRFTKVGKYEIVAQKQDDPTQKVSFDEYNLWSEDSLSRLVLFVHRQPVAQFQAYFNEAGTFHLNDLSYDLDNYTKHAKGIMKWNWKYKKVHETEWTYEKPVNLEPINQYMIALKVQDVDEAWSNETMVVLGENQKPVAYFEVEPQKASWTSSPTITDLSYSPSAIPLIERRWKVYREGQLLLDTFVQPTIASIKQQAKNYFVDEVGLYDMQLVVKDSLEQYSLPYTSSFELINYEPIPQFNVPQPIYRDDLVQIENLTGALDLDGEEVSFNWKLEKGSYSYSNTGEQLQFVTKDFGLGKTAVGVWNITLTASDTLGKEGKLTKQYVVSNHSPTSDIVGDNTAYLDETKSYRGAAYDEDSEDRSHLKSYWKVTSPSGEVRNLYTEDINMTFKQKGEYTFEHWVVDQLEASSPVYKKIVTVLNKPPVADFTMNPNPTYRATDIDFTSLSYDEDGYISSYRYIAQLPSGDIVLLSTEADFKRAFSTIGTIKVTHSVTDNDGESASVTKDLNILNHKPSVVLESPKGTRNQPQTYSVIRPSFRWVYSDVENDPQEKIRLKIERLQNNSFTTIYNQELTHSQYSISSPITFEEEQLYRLSVQVFDGYDWSDTSNIEYFNIVLNRPPVADFEFLPNPAFEGDIIYITSKASDPDNDELTYRYEVTSQNGRDIFTTADFNFKSTVLQYTVKQTVTDPKGASDSITKTITINPLTITGMVSHTEEWRKIHQKLNNSLDSFYSGEKFMLSASTTDYPIKNVNVRFSGMQVNNVNLTDTTRLNGSRTSWSGEYYKTSMSKTETFLKNGIVSFEFTVEYSNGTIKTDTVNVNIIGNVFDVQDYGRTQ